MFLELSYHILVNFSIKNGRSSVTLNRPDGRHCLSPHFSVVLHDYPSVMGEFMKLAGKETFRLDVSLTG